MASNIILGIITIILLCITLYYRNQLNQPVGSDNLTVRAKELTDKYSTENAAGEYKRHQVYAQLIKEFPGLNKRDIAYTIEKVLQASK